MRALAVAVAGRPCARRAAAEGDERENADRGGHGLPSGNEQELACISQHKLLCHAIIKKNKDTAHPFIADKWGVYDICGGDHRFSNAGGYDGDIMVQCLRPVGSRACI